MDENNRYIMVQKKIPPARIVFTVALYMVFPALILFLSGDWLWPEGWIFGTWFIVLCTTMMVYLYVRDPGLLAERYKQPGYAGQKGWDRYVVAGLVIGFIAWIVIMPLDAKRFGWSGIFPLAVKIIGGTALAFSFFFFFRSYADNTFASGLVRIQKERKQQVITTGVYGFVRHPMYLAGTLLFTGTPMLLGSYSGLAAGVLMTFLLAFRSLGEEKMMLEELEGYEDYKKKVKYRLIPFIW